MMFSVPKYNVYRKQLSGKAQLLQAEFTKKIAIEEARAKKESAKELAEAEVIRAGGISRANKIIGESLKNNKAYLTYIWIQALADNDSDVIYVPTETNLPILEANRIKSNDSIDMKPLKEFNELVNNARRAN